MVLVDSSVWIESLRRQGRLEIKVGLESLLEEYEAAFCSPVRLEVLGGANKRDRRRLNEYFSCLPYFRVLEEDWNRAVTHAWRLADQGIRVPWNDLLIACVSLRMECRLYSCDKHFEMMQRALGLRLYQPGYGGSYTPETS